MDLGKFTQDYSITFFLPTNEGVEHMGGAQLLFLQIAEYIAQNFEYTVNFIDSRNGRIATRLNQNLIRLIHFNTDQKLFLPGKQLLITKLGNIRDISNHIVFENDSMIFFWNLGTADYNTNLALMGFYSRMPIMFRKTLIGVFEYQTKKRLEKLMLLLIKKNAVAFMSGQILDFPYLTNYTIGYR